MNTAKPNWPQIRLSYLNGEGSLKALSQRYNVPLRSLERRCSRENWRHHADRVGGDVAAIAGELAVQQGRELAEKLSLPERSQKLRERVVSELEIDVDQVTKNPPQSLADSEQRQCVLGSVVRSAETVLQWNDKTPAPLVRIHILAASGLTSDPPPPDAPLALSPATASDGTAEQS